MDTKYIGLEFEKLVIDLFEAEGFTVDRRGHSSRDLGFDLLIKTPANKTAVVEIKLYRTNSVSSATILQIASQLELARRNMKADSSIIVLGTEVTPTAKDALKETNVLLYGAGELKFLAFKNPALLKRLEEILRESKPFSPKTSDDPVKINPSEDVKNLKISSAPPTVSIQSIVGASLCSELKAIEPGRKEAKKFEEKSLEALKYVFEDDISAWSDQQATDTSISIYDAIGRVSSQHDFWKTVISQFKSLYVIFEFKNYENEIKQTQIYTTEKYLFRTALRSTAIIISRLGADENAIAAAKGALREHGKLIINLSLKDLCRMLDLKDKKDDHNAVLVEYLDRMLMRLER